MYIPVKQPSIKGLARLLNITIEECKKLKHAPMIEERNNMGAVTGYFMHISPNNDALLLSKIIIVKSNFIWFSVKQIAGIAKI
ncbi:hypothetical protein F0919_17450 [Taibaiella lutea]|uniref:Uncharacterized protein n=1 Tax=Taibaiella lutea TaxID=2608001 RepID=A0A5M6CBJ0_9BACT|nr:hypothetical protein [Taibaiella lutea]KAA5532568.1 hypothetical protein F0919_17450 [Taibaiella lutea]